MAANVGHGRLAEEEAAGHLPSADAGALGLPRLLRLHDRHACRNQDVALLDDGSVQVRFRLQPGNACLRERLSTVDLLVLTCSDELLLKLIFSGG